MPFDQFTPRAFTTSSIQNHVPSTSGVYGFSNAKEWIYIGETGDLRAALFAHLAEVNTPLKRRQPTGFVFEECASAVRHGRQDRLVHEYEPFCNRRH